MRSNDFIQVQVTGKDCIHSELYTLWKDTGRSNRDTQFVASYCWSRWADIYDDLLGLYCVAILHQKHIKNKKTSLMMPNRHFKAIARC